MNAILTRTHTSKGKTKVIAETASRKSASVISDNKLPNAIDHRKAAELLSQRLGWGTNLAAGETRRGFAFVPIISDGKPDFSSITLAASILCDAANAFPKGEKDPIRLAAGIIDIFQAKFAAK